MAIGITITYGKTDKDPDKDLEEPAVNTVVEGEAVETEPKAVAPKKLRNDLLPEFKLETRKLSTLVPAKHRVRKSDKRQIAKVARSIQSLGFRDPPLIGKDGEIVDGHIRVEAAKSRGFSEIQCIVAQDMSEEEIRLLRIALNRTQERGVWDELALKLEMAFLLEFEPDLTVTGFEAPDVDFR